MKKKNQIVIENNLYNLRSFEFEKKINKYKNKYRGNIIFITRGYLKRNKK